MSSKQAVLDALKLALERNAPITLVFGEHETSAIASLFVMVRSSNLVSLSKEDEQALKCDLHQGAWVERPNRTVSLTILKAFDDTWLKYFAENMAKSCDKVYI